MRRTDRIKLLLMMSLFAVPALAAWIAHQVWTPAMAASYGELLQPAVPRLAGMTDAAGNPADLSSLRGRWVLLTVANAACGPACRQELDLARRVRLAQGREMERVARILVQAASATPVIEPDLHSYHVPGAVLAAWPDPVRTYLVDPLGRVMLRFPVAAEGKGMLRDLRQLLKASKIG
jgi:cytochrome oxidase Cu insertion factor (SCO1/SenC/PrrC family)